MINNLGFFLFFLSCIASYSAKSSDNIDETKEQIEFNIRGLRHGDYYYKNGKSDKDTIEIKGQYKNGLKSGEWIYRLNDECTEITANYKKGILNGTYLEIGLCEDYDEKSVMVEGRYEEGFKSGKWKYARNDFNIDIQSDSKICFVPAQYDRIVETIKYKKGEKSGYSYFEVVASNEEYGVSKALIVFSGNYLEDKRDGEWILNNIIVSDAGKEVIGEEIGKFYFENGQPSSEWIINEGLRFVGLLLPYDSLLNGVKIKCITDDQSWSKGFYLNGYKHGEWKFYDSNNRYLKTVVYNKGRAELETAKKVYANLVIDDFVPKKIDFYDISEDDKYIVIGKSRYFGDLDYWVYDYSSKKLLKSGAMAKPSFMSISACRFSPSESENLIVENMMEEETYTINWSTSEVLEVANYECAEWGTDVNDTILDFTKSQKVETIKDWLNWQPVWSDFNDIVHNGAMVSFSAKEMNKFYTLNLKNMKLEERSEGKVKSTYLSGEKYKDIGSRSLLFKEQDEGTNYATELIDEILFSWEEGLYANNPDYSKFITVFEDKSSYIKPYEAINTIYFWNSKYENKSENHVAFNLNVDGGFVLYTRDGYYFADQSLSNSLHFEFNDNIYPYEQFDLKYNRPDIVLSRLGYADSSLIQAYKRAYVKRLEKMNFNEEMLEDDFNIPTINIQNKERIPTESDQGFIEFDIKMRDEIHHLDRINVWVNNVAIFGVNGISVREINKNEIEQKIKISLAKGRNQIQVSVLNQAGAESLVDHFEINCKYGKDKPDLYLITIGESKFEQSKYNLNYAAKDATDVASLLSKSNVYENVISTTLINQEVTKSSIANLKTILKEADINDHVLIFIAGHGVLDANLDYFIATYDMDFENPAKNGLPYAELEKLLDNIAPLKKTLIIDACHSGEIDKSEIALAKSSQEEFGDIQFRAVGNTVSTKLGMANTSELMKSLFTDLRKGTGATVLSSAGGIEYAMESKEWNNGLFTYCFLDGIKAKKADINQDGEIWLSEIQQYVGKEVSSLSKGMQKPTSRIENKAVDFRVW